MSVLDTSDIFNFADVFDTVFGNDSTAGAHEIVTCHVRDAGEEDGVDDTDVELWDAGCVMYRPAAPTDDGACQLLTVPIGAQRVAIASRDLRAVSTVGALNAGDAAFCSPTGGGVLRANADGSIGMRKNASDGSTDAFIQIEKDGTILIGNQYGHVELGKNGFMVVTSTGEAFSLGGGNAALQAPHVAINGGSVGLGVGAAVPLAIAPNAPPPGFVVTKPCPNIFI